MFLDDQTEQTETLDRQLKLLSDVELNDDTVVEYLLDLSLEVKSKPTQSPTVQVSPVCIFFRSTISYISVFKRKGF